MKEINIKVSLKELDIDEGEVRQAVIEQVRNMLNVDTKYSGVIREVIKETILDEINNNRKAIKEKVKMFVSLMEGSSLYYNDDFRKLTLELVRENKNLLDKRVKEHIDAVDYTKVIDACGESMAQEFYRFIRNQD